MSGEIRADVARKIIERAARGQTWLRIGRELSVPAAVAEEVARYFGHPSTSHMRAAVNNLAGLGVELVTYGSDAPGPGPDPLVDVETPEGAALLAEQLDRERAARLELAERPLSLEARQREEATQLSPAELIEQTVRGLSVDQLLERAAKSSRGSVRADAARVPQLLERLRVAIISDEREAATRARVAELRRELAQLEGRGEPRARHECTRPGCNYSTVQTARFTAHTAAHDLEETTDA